MNLSLGVCVCVFTGKQFWVFKDTVLQPGYPKDITQFAKLMPSQSIETAVSWEDVGKTYFFKGDRCVCVPPIPWTLHLDIFK